MCRALFYVDALPEVGEQAVVDGDEGFHAASVRRIRRGEQLDLSDGAGALAHCVIEDVGKARLTARVLERATVPSATPAVTVVQALPKSDRSELAIELATEAGADGFVAWQASRCVTRWDGQARVEKGLRRWRAVARSAARQSRRAQIPPVTGVVSTAELAQRVTDDVATGAVVLALHESATERLTKLLSGAGRFGDVDRRAGRRHRRRRNRRRCRKPARHAVRWARRCCGPRPPRPSRWVRWAC